MSPVDEFLAPGKSACAVMNPAALGTWIAVALVITSWLVLLVSFLRHRRRGGGKYFRFPPPPVRLNRSSFFTWFFYCFGALSQFTPVAILTRVLSPPHAIFAYDAYVLGWFVLAGMLLIMPALVADMLPLFVLWTVESFALFAYELVYITGLPMHLRRQTEFPVAYRMFLGQIITYLTVAILAAAMYRANWAYIGLEANSGSVRDALYVSIVILTTLGFGDFAPRDCLRWVTMWETLTGIFIIVVGFATVIGVIASSIITGDEPPGNNNKLPPLHKARGGVFCRCC